MHVYISGSIPTKKKNKNKNNNQLLLKHVIVMNNPSPLISFYYENEKTYYIYFWGGGSPEYIFILIYKSGAPHQNPRKICMSYFKDCKSILFWSNEFEKERISRIWP